MSRLKAFVRKIPIIGPVAKAIFGKKPLTNEDFPGSAAYWEQRYSEGGNSGSGSYSNLAKFKARIINEFVETNGVESVVEFGCGDGHQLSLASYPHYIGLDVSPTIIEQCQKKFAGDSTKEFYVLGDSNVKQHRADLSMSLDVLFHIIEYNIYEQYLKELFAAAQRFVIIYSSNIDREQTFHERHRKFTDWVSDNMPDWKLIDHIPNEFPFDPKDPDHTSEADFFIYAKN